jgi:hypothetical protein
MLEFCVFAAMTLAVVAVMLVVAAPVAGLLLIVDSLLKLMFGEPFYALLWLVVGSALWLVGHLAIAHFNDGFWRSSFAELVFRLPGLRALRPTW